MKAKKLMLRLAGATALLAFAVPALPCEGMKGTAFDSTPPAQEKMTKEKDKIAIKAPAEKPGEKASAKPAEKSAKN